jgi:modulator of FtsH protease
MNEWRDFFIAIAGAAAALTGLLFVGVSINLTRILSFPGLPERALLSLALLLNILIISCLMLIPLQSLQMAGVEILVTGLLIWMTAIRIDYGILKTKNPEFKPHYKAMMVLSQFATLPYLVCGILILCTNANGIYWIVPAIIFSFIKAMLDAWVLLVEINR